MNRNNLLRYDEWVERYHPRINPHADYGFEGTLFETFAPDLHTVQANMGKRIVWTLLDHDTIVSGFRFVNRVGYFITEIPYQNEEITVDL